MKNLLGEKLSPILVELETTIMENQQHSPLPPEYTNDGFRAATYVFLSVIMDKIWTLNTAENMDMETRCAMAEKCGHEIRNLIKTYTGIDSHNLYK